MSKLMQVVIVVVVITVALVLEVIYSDNGKGIVILDGYAHGVAMCDGTEDSTLETQVDTYHTWTSDGIFYMINYGHLSDKEVSQLVALATTHCAQYLTK